MARVWALLSSREGDNAQVLAVAEALKCPYETRRFQNRPGAIVANLLFGPSLPGMVTHPSGDFGPPWPDLVIAAGTQSEPICAQIRRATQQAGHSTRQVFLGRPWIDPARYDLVVTTPQYWVPPGPNVMEIDLPLHRVTAERIAPERDRWSQRLAELPAPYFTVLLGGSISSYTFDSRAAKRLALEASALASAAGGSLLVCGSYRTPSQVMKAMVENIHVPARIFEWRQSRQENPYLALLGLAREIIVTGDSMTMLAEACATGKPVHIFDLGEGRYAMRDGAPQGNPVIVHHPWLMSALRARAKHHKVSLTNGILPLRLHRDTRNIHRKLIQSGRAVWLGDAFPSARVPRAGSDVTAVAARIQSLISDTAAFPATDDLPASGLSASALAADRS
ncbi:MAG TPA: ELM1/GtrOC1 family putative glycosyltransferase [Dongiaceae bacterium]